MLYSVEVHVMETSGTQVNSAEGEGGRRREGGRGRREGGRGRKKEEGSWKRRDKRGRPMGMEEGGREGKGGGKKEGGGRVEGRVHRRENERE